MNSDLSSAPEMPAFSVRIERGGRSDYARLARHHYVGGPPATFDRVLRAVENSRHQGAGGAGARIVGVLVVSRAPLNAAWRLAAWPEREKSIAGASSRRDKALFINQHIRRISRVIVDPRFRGLGIARSLVQAYLADPITDMTEAVAAMALACPIFERAGMRRVESDAMVSHRNKALGAAIAAAGLEPWELMDAARTLGLIRSDDALHAAARRWANDSRHSRNAASDTRLLAREVMFGAARLVSGAKVFVFP